MSTIRLVEGSASSGNFGHAGRPGEVGGSASGSHIDRLSIDPNPRSFSNLFDKSLGPTSAALASNLGFPFTTEQANKATIHETGGIRFVGPYLSSVDAIDRAHVPNDPEFAKAIETETARMSQIPGMPKISAILSYKLEHGTAAMTMLNPQTGPDRQVMLFSDIKISSYATTANIMRGITKDGYVDDKVSSAKIVSVPHDFLTPNNATGWFATKSVATIIVDHEFGHAWMNANEGSEKAWLDAGKKDKETDANTNARISVYGAASVTENFAESFTHYVNGGPVKTMGAAKTAYLDAHFKDHVQHTPIRRSLKESLVEAIAASKAKLTQQDAEFKSVLKRATRSHVFAIEADVLRYQRDLIFILDRRLNAIDNAKDDAGHLALILMSLAHDFERVGAKYLRTACDAGFKRLIDDLLARKILSKTYGVIRAPELIVQSVIAANSAYIRDSLTPDLHAKIHQSADGVTTAQKFKERIKLYGHYLWSAAEQSYSLGLDLYSAKVKTVKNLREGSASSGNFAPDHVGRPGLVGGSGDGGGNDLGLSKSAFDTKNKFGSDTGGVNDEWFSENKNTITAWYDNLRIQLPTKYLATLDGVAHASISASNPHVLDYTEKMKAAGSYDAFLKDYHGVNHDITLQVNADGKQQIYEGNARAQAAHNAGYANIPVRIIFVGGGERFWRPTDIPKSLREGSATSGNFAPDHVGRPGLVGGSGNANGASSQPGEHVLKVSNAPGEHTIVINSVTDRVLEYNGSSKEPDIQNTLLSEIDKNINEIPAQVRQLNEVFFTDDMHAFSMVDGYTSMSNTTGVTLSNSPTVGFNTAVIASHVFGKGADFSVADVATSREQYSRLVADHEMGHVLYNTLGNNVKADWHELVGYFTKDTMKELSKYSATQPMEAFAEAYSKYVNNMSLAVSFKEFMRDNVKIGDHHLHESDVSIDQPIAFLCGFGDGPTYHVYKDRVEKFPLTIRLTEGSASSGNFDHAGRPGLRGGSAQGRDPVPIALRGLAASGGFSVSIHGVVPHQGYMIAGDISEETHPIVGGTQAGVRKAIVEFAGSHGRLLNKSERYIGGWVEKNQVVLDVSKRFAVGRSEALQIARSKDQIAVYKLGNPGKTIYTMSDKLRPSESKGKILESDRPDDGIAFIIAPGQNIEEAARKIAEAWGAKFNRK